MDKNYANYLLDKTKKDYNLIAKDFSRTRSFVWPETKFLFLDYLKDGDKVLDLGCGNGRYFSLCRLKDIEYFGIDNAEDLIKEAKKNYPQAKFQVADALKIPFPDNYFDKVYSIAVFHQIPSKNYRLQFLKEIKRVLKKRGWAILTVWKFYRLKDWFLLIKYTILKLLGKSKLDFKDFFEPWGRKTKRYYHWFSKRELIKLVKGAGFIIKDIGIVKNKRKNRRNIYLIIQK